MKSLQIITFSVKTFLFSLLFSTTVVAQVGINTTSPNANSMLDVNGRVVVRDFSRTGTGLVGVKLLLVEADGTLITATVPADALSVSAAQAISLNNTASGASTEKITVVEENFNTKNNWDLDLDGDNSDVTVFIVHKSSGGGELKIRGISGGTEGRKIRIINDSGENIKFEEDKSQANDGNRIYIYTEHDKLKDYGSCELVYSTDVSSGLGHWCIVQLDRYDD